MVSICGNVAFLPFRLVCTLMLLILTILFFTLCLVTATVALAHSCAMKSLIAVPRVSMQNLLNAASLATSMAPTRIARHFFASFVLYRSAHAHSFSFFSTFTNKNSRDKVFL